MYTSCCGALLVDKLVSSCSTVSSSQRGNTPMLLAALKGHAEVARFLLESGSNVKEHNNVGLPKRASVKCPGII